MILKIERAARPGVIAMRNHDGSFRWSGAAPPGIFEALGARRSMFVKASRMKDGRLDLRREVNDRGW